MYELKIPTQTVNSLLSRQVIDNRSNYSRKMLEISSGLKYSSRSENPGVTAEAAQLLVTATQLNTWTTNMNTAQSWQQITDSTNQQIMEIMYRTNELVTQANTGVNSVGGRDAVVAELNSILESLVQFGNTRYQDASIYAGTATCIDKDGNPCKDPFTVDRVGNEITAVYFLGNDTAVIEDNNLREIASGADSTIQVGLLGEGRNGLFSYSRRENVGTEETPVYEDVNVRLFDELIKLRDTLKDPTGTLDEKNLARIQAGIDNVTARNVDVAASMTMIKYNLSNISGIAQSTNTRISDLLATDEAAAITELYQIQSALQASMQMINMMNGMSILNYIG